MNSAWKILEHGKIAIIGDVHGYYSTLEHLIQKISKEYPNHKIVFAGDLIDKGLRSKNVVDLVIEKNYDVVLGNHDRLMGAESNPKHWKHYESLWKDNHGIKTWNSYGKKYYIMRSKIHRQKFMSHVNFMKNLPLVLEFPNIKINNRTLILSHAPMCRAVELIGGIDSLKKLINQDVKTLWKQWLNSYVNEKIPNFEDHFEHEHIVLENLLNHKINNIKEIHDIENYHQVFGHVVFDEVQSAEYATAVDTWVYKPNKLSAQIFPENKTVSVDTIKDTKPSSKDPI